MVAVRVICAHGALFMDNQQNFYSTPVAAPNMNSLSVYVCSTKDAGHKSALTEILKANSSVSSSFFVDFALISTVMD